MDSNWKTIENELNKIPYVVDKVRNSNIILFGAAMRGAWAFQRMREEGYHVIAFTDNNYRSFMLRVGGGEGIPVIAPDEISNIPDAFVIITVTGHLYQVIKEQLDGLGYPHMTHMELTLLLHKEDFYTVYSSFFEDDLSKQIYENILIGHLRGNAKYFKEFYMGSQYFAIPEFDTVSGSEVFVDCGAYVGDTVERYIMHKGGEFKKIYAFEPTRASFLAMVKRIERLNAEWNSYGRIEAYPYAVGERTEELAISACLDGATGNRVYEGQRKIPEQTVLVVSLDEFFEGKEDIPTYIKVDIEGEELHMIRGAKGILAKHKPKLAICVYHRDEDLYEIPMELRKINPEYRFALRHHRPQFLETVLYCW